MIENSLHLEQANLVIEFVMFAETNCASKEARLLNDDLCFGFLCFDTPILCIRLVLCKFR